MTYNDIERFVQRQAKIIRDRAPKDTGNLRASIRVQEIEPFVWKISVNTGDDAYARVSRSKKELDWGLAPYTPFTNEAWVSPKWRGRQNPNEGWWNNAVEIVLHNLEMRTNGILEQKSNVND